MTGKQVSACLPGLFCLLVGDFVCRCSGLGSILCMKEDNATVTYTHVWLFRKENSSKGPPPHPILVHVFGTWDETQGFVHPRNVPYPLASPQPFTGRQMFHA